MGIYYMAMDHKKKQKIEPPGDFSIKSPGIFHPHNPFPNMVIMANALGNNFEIVNDCDENTYYADGYEDKTDYFYDMLKRYFPNYDFDKAEWKKEMGED
jgi:hypothetical protein